tara:strand:+ start:24723 stop:26006 length:1284 start_codon:yes stop_codon:yes gene_type:complete
MHDWIKNNIFSESPGWDSYPISIRIVNWIKFSLNGNNLSEEVIDSIGSQAYYLSKNIEYHLYGNHLLRNAKALCFAGIFINSKYSKEWLKNGLAILDQEIDEQILKDGAHIELSPMYHSNCLEDFLDLINLFRAYESSELKSIEKKLEQSVIIMMNWLDKMCHPDGEISFFNDSAIGIALKPSLINQYSKQLSINQFIKEKNEVTCFNDSGYIIVNNNQYKLICDVGEIGCKYVAGHGHADILSFELSVSNKRLIVNSGTSIYGNSELRINQRKTKSHNTIEINGKDSSEIWNGFRVGRRVSPFDIEIKGNTIKASYKSYKRLLNYHTHTREWKTSIDKIEIFDKIEGNFFSANSYFHFHPDITITLENNILRLFDKATSCDFKLFVEGAVINVEDSFWYPEFGAKIPNKKIMLDLIDGYSKLTIGF